MFSIIFIIISKILFITNIFILLFLKIINKAISIFRQKMKTH
uniref:Uncharacterized protein n=1 Tax=viral metagenome TaxID=1070528 RepID=A0A6C0E0T2_9ZZZZ